MNRLFNFFPVLAIGGMSLCCSSCEKSGEGSGGEQAGTKDVIVVGGYSHAARISTFNPADYPYMKYPSRVYCFGTSPSADGKWYINQTYEQKIEVMRKAMTSSQEAFLVIGGGGTAKNMYVMGTDEAKRNAYVEAMVAYAHANGYDGIDIDWETAWSENPPLRIPAEDLVALLQKIREEMAALPSDTKVRKLSCALSSIEHEIGGAVKDYVDEINVMIYDCYGETEDADGTYPHAPMSQFIERLGNYRDAGVPNEKIIAGVPFYGGDKKQEGTPTQTYNVLFAQSGGAITAATNSWDGYAFNGVDLIREKTQYLVDNGYAGIMVWEISQDIDYDEPLSLMRAIKSVTAVR